MASALTHINFVNDLKKEHKKLFKTLDLQYVYSGALFPDYYGFYKIQLKKQYEIEKIIKNQKGITFGKRMLSIAKTKEEKSFAIGFISHSVLDKHFHNYIKKNANKLEEHISLEFFYDCKYINLKVPTILYPKNIMEKTLKKYYQSSNIKRTDITLLNLKIYQLFLIEVKRQIINKKYINNKKIYIEFLSNFFKKKNINLKKILTPDLKLKKKHINNLEVVYNEALLENNEIIKELKIS